MDKNIKILITGSSGYIGNCLKNYLKKKYTLYLIDKNRFKNKEKNFFLCNLKNKQKTINIIRKINPDTIIHLAGQANLNNINDKDKYIQNNIIATKNLLKATELCNTKNIIFSSTANVYLDNIKKVSEKSIVKPKNIYSKSKLICEKNIINESKKLGFKYIIFRFFNVCSAITELKCGSLHKPETSFIPIIINKFLKDKVIKLYSNSKNDSPKRDYIHIYDLCNALDKGIKYLRLKKKSNIFNIGSNNSISSYNLLKYFNDKLGKNKLKFNFTGLIHGEIRKSECSNSKIKKELLWKPIKSNLKNIFNDELNWQKYCVKNKIKRKFIY